MNPYNFKFMHLARIAELLQPFLINACHSEQGQRPGEESVVLSTPQLQNISMYIDILFRWNARINLTAIRDPEKIVTRHFGESLFAARRLFPNEGSQQKHHRERHDFSRVDSDSQENRPLAPEVDASRVRAADLGSGAGFPGIPIKLWAPHISMTLIEANQKKATFLREVVRALTLTDIDIQNARAESITQTFDVVTLRAVERFANILSVATRLLAPSGQLALLIAASQIEAARSNLPQFMWEMPILIPRSDSRMLFVGTQEPSK